MHLVGGITLGGTHTRGAKVLLLLLHAAVCVCDALRLSCGAQASPGTRRACWAAHNYRWQLVHSHSGQHELT